MSAYTHGSATFSVSGVTLVSTTPVFDQGNGNTWERLYEGTPSGIATVAAVLQGEGARTRIDQNGPVARLVASFVRNPDESASAETPFDVWNLDDEEYQVSLFATPRAVAEAQGYVNVAQYRSDIEDAARNGEAFPLDSATYPAGRYIYNLLAAGIDTMPQHRPFLSRQRSYSISYPGTPYRVNPNGLVYTRAALVRDFGIVDPLLSRIPFDIAETLPEGFVWGWYLARQSMSYQRERGAIKVTEQLGWRYGSWNAWPASSSIQGLYQLIE